MSVAHSIDGLDTTAVTRIEVVTRSAGISHHDCNNVQLSFDAGALALRYNRTGVDPTYDWSFDSSLMPSVLRLPELLYIAVQHDGGAERVFGVSSASVHLQDDGRTLKVFAS